MRYIIILLGISFLLVRHPEKLTRISVLGPYIIFVTGAILNTIYLSLLLFKKTEQFLYSFVITQLVIDTLLVSGLVFFTGGLFSAITSFYFAVILSASVTLSRRDSIIFASLSIILFSIIHILYAFEFYPHIWQAAWKYKEWQVNTLEIVSKLLFHAAGFYTVAILSGTLSNMLRTVRILNIEILENISEGLLVVDGKKRITFYNPAFLDLFGFEEKEVLKNMDASLLFDSSNFKQIQEIINKDFSKCGEISLKNNKGELRDLNIKVSELTDRKKTSKGFIILFEDFSLNKQMEKALIKIDRYRTIVEISAGIAHEIKNPLASIRGCVEELEKETSQNDANRRLFNIVKEESDRLAIIITDFFEYLKGSPPQKAVCNLEELILDTIETTKTNDSFKHIEFVTEFKEPISIDLDKNQWKQVFLNLFLNASEADASIITITASTISAEEVTFARKFVSLEEIDCGIQITVSDTGHGLPQENVSNIFIPFYTTKEKGIGIGLSIVNRIIRSHGGIIEAQSGSASATFIITLPVYKE